MTDPTNDREPTPHDLNSPPSSDYVAEAAVKADKAAARDRREAEQRERQDAAHEKAKAERECCGAELRPWATGGVVTPCGRPAGHPGACRPAPLTEDRTEGEDA